MLLFLPVQILNAADLLIRQQSVNLEMYSLRGVMTSMMAMNILPQRLHGAVGVVAEHGANTWYPSLRSV